MRSIKHHFANQTQDLLWNKLWGQSSPQLDNLRGFFLLWNRLPGRLTGQLQDMIGEMLWAGVMQDIRDDVSS